MKRTAIILSVTLLGFTACDKSALDSKSASSDDYALMNEITNEESELQVKDAGFDKVILVALEKPDGYDYYTKGVVQFNKNGEELAKIDFGNGEKDSWATKEVDGKVTKFDMSKKKKGCDFDKKVIEPIVKSEGCKYIVSGIVKYYKNGKWIATVDYGDGTCDNIATKTWKGGTKTFNLDYDYKKKGK